MIDEKILKSEEAAVFALRSLYRRYGYLPYKMSKFEEYEYYIRNKDFLISDRFITFTDTNGRLLALKPDVTLSIIKNREDSPGCKQKVYYNENIYRVDRNTRQYKEIMQTGLECIGDIDLYDIFETVSLAAQSLALISGDFILQISHLGILAEALDRTGADSAFRQAAIGYIAAKNAHDLARLCEANGVDSNLLTGFVSAYGSRSNVLQQLEVFCPGPALEELKSLSALLDTSPHSGRIVFDFSVVGNMNYYNGIVFKGFLSGICEGILSGGRYDKLMRKMDRRAGAIGFALYLDLLEQLPAVKNDCDVDVLLLYHDDTDPAAVAAAVSRLTADGQTVTAQKAVPLKLRYRRLIDLGKEGAVC
ncbi:MAG: ATP phosphoribosyltransferase regulatory subunit [Oscillospiraceae bacterium]|nr:ATP phosphoribosyltransferase regulatory subunit [Oscillospiraceae bacterium]